MMDGILSRRIHPDCERELKSRYRSCRRLYKVVVYFGCTVTTHATVTPLVATLINALLSDDPLPFESWPMFLVSYCWMAGPEFTPNDRGNLLSTLIYIAAVFFNYCRCADNIAHQKMFSDNE
ncbi:unnamed protein product [Nesidiocoris tenuis]|uniref:Uncharacterized protein n=1 Tax=Nesidiocoris tenuis TaxID=355587 RepID=A0A6H5HEA7_9HEMI|nr:unnamed protein product [Nesidiocoris tenuis]